MFTNLYARGIFFAERKLAPWRPRPVAIIHPPAHSGNAATAVGDPTDESATDDVQHRLIRVAKQTTAQPAMHSPVLVHGKCSVLTKAEPVTLDTTHA